MLSCTRVPNVAGDLGRRSSRVTSWALEPLSAASACAVRGYRGPSPRQQTTPARPKSDGAETFLILDRGA